MRPLEHEHTAEAIRARLADGPRHSYLRDWVYGGIDGTVTTFAIVSGVVGADLSPTVILILGAVNLLGDGFSMAASNYSSTRTEVEEIERLRAVERRHIRIDPHGEREEIRQIYAAKGFAGQDLERIVHVISADPERWIRTMLAEEYGVAAEVRSPAKAALSTFAAFVICGLVPLLPFVTGIAAAFPASVALTAGAFFGIGSVRGRLVGVRWWRSGTETLAIGSVAAALAYLAGAVLKKIVGSA
jgi:VIT1/CCC1 family predicted Fe2+/Mn2+ transporter